jgi:putative Holliday junction resolvase
MKYLGIDYGARRVGVAVSDSDGIIAFPRSTLHNDEQLISHLQTILHAESIEAIVIGDTRTHGGAPNPISARTDAFTQHLMQQSGLPIERSWEVWSSIEAGRFAGKGHEHDDASAAAFILQRFLDMRKQPVGVE